MRSVPFRGEKTIENPGNAKHPKDRRKRSAASMKPENEKELSAFIEEWPASPERNKDAFIRLRDVLIAQSGVTLDFIPRPGVT